MVSDRPKTGDLSIKDLHEARRKIAELEGLLAEKSSAEEALREAEERYRALFEQAADHILVFDPETLKPVAFNQRVCDDLGYTQEEILSMTIADLDIKDSAEVITQRSKEIIEHGPQTIETLVRTKSGEIHNHWVNIKAINTGGRTLIQTIARDITDRKRIDEELRFSQMRLNEAQDLAQMGNWERDLKSGKIYPSDGLYRIFGYAPGEVTLTNRFLNNLIHPEHKKLFQEFLQKTYSGSQPANYEFCFYRKDGAQRYAYCQTRIIKDSSGKPVRVFGTLKDITEFKITESALKEKEKALQEQTESLKEVNTALKVLLDHREDEKVKLEENILGNVKKLVFPYTARLKRGQLSEEQKTLLSIVESNLAQITSQFTTRLSSATIGLTPKELEIAALVRDGMSCKEIATIMNVSENAVRFHRFNIRHKLGLNKKSINLRSYLCRHLSSP
jgi:PAS domain S-box-containing protein